MVMPDNSLPVVLCIAGSDSCAAAGIQADIKTCAMLDVYAATAITAVTAQNTQQVTAVQPLPAELVAAQIKAVRDDMAVAAIKIGMLSQQHIIDVVAAAVADCNVPVIVDPVMVSTSGQVLLDGDALTSLQRLLTQATLITPNVDELAALLSQSKVSQPGMSQPRAENEQQLLQQGRQLSQQTGAAVLVKGGHWQGDMATDWLVEGEVITPFDLPRLDNIDCRGTGCTLSSAIAALLAIASTEHNKSVPDSEQTIDLATTIGAAKQQMQRLLQQSSTYTLGCGSKPLKHF